METITLENKIIWHQDYNLDKKNNLGELPTEKAVFGIFGMVDKQAINCRYVGESENLQAAIKELFEQSAESGMKDFMQGPWIKILQYQLMPKATSEDIQQLLEDMTSKFQPKIDEEGEYPGYYEN